VACTSLEKLSLVIAGVYGCYDIEVGMTGLHIIVAEICACVQHRVDHYVRTARLGSAIYVVAHNLGCARVPGEIYEMLRYRSAGSTRGIQQSACLCH